MEPREVELGELKDQVSSVDDELQDYSVGNARLDNRIGSLRAEIDSLLVEITTARATLKERTHTLEAFDRELFISVNAAGSDPRQHVLAALRIAAAHGPTGGGALTSEVDLSYVAESLRQQEHLGSLATQLRARVHAATIGRRSDSGALVAENSAVIAQLHSLREAAGAARSQTRVLARQAQRASANNT